MLPALLYLCATSLLLQTSTATSPTHRISLAASSPTNAANVPHDFVSFSIETVFLDDYNNDFSRNLINSIAQRMSLDPIIRVGGVSGDLVKYEPQQRDSAVCIAGSCPNGSQSIFSLGPSYFNGFTAFSNARITVQAPMGNKTSINETDYELNIALDYVSLAVKALGGPGPKLKAIELGNGANSYDPNGADYARAALKRASAIAKNLTLTGNEAALFEVCETQTSYYEPKNANLSSGPNSFFPAAFEAGISDTGLVTIGAEHYYKIDAPSAGYTITGNLQIDLMNHSAAATKFANYQPHIALLRNEYANVSYALTECGTALQGPTSYAGSLGATLGYIDFQLLAMSAGVTRLSSNQSPSGNYSAWVPIDLASNPGPQVRAPFYAQPFIADFIGDSTCQVSAVELDLHPKSEYLTAYALYEDNSPARVALINLREWNSTSGTHRGRSSFAIDVPSGKSNVTLSKLYAEAGASALGFDADGQNITWAGEQWSYKADQGRGHLSGPVSAPAKVHNGVAVVDVVDSEAVIVFFQ